MPNIVNTTFAYFYLDFAPFGYSYANKNHPHGWFFVLQEGLEPEMGAKKLRSNALSDRETVRWTVSTFLQRSEATAIKSLLLYGMRTAIPIQSDCDFLPFLIYFIYQNESKEKHYDV